MRVTIRRAVAEDAPQLARVAAATFGLACPPHTTQESIATFVRDVLSERNFDAYLADPARILLVAEADVVGQRQAVGYTMVVLGEPHDADARAAISQRPAAELSKLYVLPDRHGGGIPAQLMAHSLTAARDAGAIGVWLGVNKLNARAIRFYEKSRSAQVGEKRFQVGSRLEHDFVLERAL
jgi:ribosomal protein S18 acetylase RimI-like enzyme